MEALSTLWGAAAAVGSGLSVVFIVIIAVVLGLLALVYGVAALLVLARFARASSRIGPAIAAGLAIAILISLLRLRVDSPELALASWSVWGAAWLGQLAVLLPGCAAAMALYAAALRRPLLLRLPILVLAPGAVLIVVAYLSGDLGDGADVGTVLSLSVWGVVVGALLGLLPLAFAGLIEIRRGPEWFIALRYLMAERRQVFISVITLICVGAVSAGVWLIITVLSVMNGFERTWRDEIVGNYAHFLVRSYYGHVVEYPDVLARIEAVDGVVAANPYLDADGMVRGSAGRIAPIRLRGIERERATRVTRLGDKIVEGDLADIESVDEESPHSPGLVIGRALAEELRAGPGDELILISPQGGTPTALGTAPRLMRFRVVGLYESSFLQFDELYAFADLPSVQRFIGASDVVAGFEVRTTDFFRSRPVASAVEDELGHPFFARDWKELFPQFFHALNDNRSLMFLLLVMIMVVSAFVIVVTLMMMIMAKSTDVAILKTMGARDESIELVFAIEGALIGVAGVAAGVLAGIAVSTRLAWIQEQIEAVTGIDTLPASVYQISTLPSEVDPVQVVGVVSIALVLALGATLLPSRHGARLDPVEALRDE